MFSYESPHRGDSNKYTQYNIFQYKKGNHPKLSQISSYWDFFQGTPERVRNSHVKRAISVRATEGLSYFVEVMLGCLLLGFWLYISFCHFANRSYFSSTPLTVFEGF